MAGGFGGSGGGEFGLGTSGTGLGFLSQASPYAFIPGYLFGIITKDKFFNTNPLQPLEDLFEGKPRILATEQAVLRFGASTNPALKQYGKDLAKLAQGGVVLSSSDPIARANLNKIFQKADTALRAEGLSKVQAFDVLVSGINPPLAPALSVAQRGLPSARVSTVPVSSRLQPVLDTSRPPMNPFQSSGPLKSAGQSFADQFVTKATGLLTDIIPGARELETITGQTINYSRPPSIQDTLAKGPVRISDLFSGQPGDGTNQPGIGHQKIIDPRDCPTCNPQQAQMRAQLTQEQRDLQDELQVEQGQQRGKTISDQRQQVDQFRDLERQPVQGRDIPHEIQQKMNLLQQVGNELAQLQHEIDNPQSLETTAGNQQPVPSMPPPVGGTGNQTIIEPDTSPKPGSGQMTEQEHEHELDQLFIQGEGTEGQGDPTKAVKFCVGCVTQLDAQRFLNGEPSACSVFGYPA